MEYWQKTRNIPEKFGNMGLIFHNFVNIPEIPNFLGIFQNFLKWKKLAQDANGPKYFHSILIMLYLKNNSWNIVINSLWYFVIWAKYFKSVRGILRELHPVIFRKKSWNTNLNSWNIPLITSEKCPFFTIFSKHSKKIFYCLQKWRSYNRN